MKKIIMKKKKKQLQLMIIYCFGLLAILFLLHAISESFIGQAFLKNIKEQQNIEICIESDDGFQPLIPGIIKGKIPSGTYSEIEDDCYYDTNTGAYTTTLFEYYCKNNIALYKEVDCSTIITDGTCVDGACIEEPYEESPFYLQRSAEIYVYTMADSFGEFDFNAEDKDIFDEKQTPQSVTPNKKI